MRHLSYSETIKELEKPIYLEYAKGLWDICYHEFGDVVKTHRAIVSIAGLFVDFLETERRKDIDADLLSLLDKLSQDNIEHYYSLYESHFLQKRIAEHHQLICDISRVGPVLSFLKQAVEALGGKDYVFLLTGGYLDFGPRPLYDYERSILVWDINRIVSQERIIWEMTNKEGITIRQSDIACIWGSLDGYYRFIDCFGRWGFLDIINNNRYYMPDEFYSIGDLCDGLAWFYVQGKGYGYCDYKGDIIIPVKFKSACNFEWVKGQHIARVKYLFEYGPKFAHDYTKKTICGDPVETGITALADELYIDESGHHLREYEELFRKQEKEYLERAPSITTSTKKRYRSSNIDLSEEDIMGMISGGNGDILGFGD